jgi:hypothetical protein
MVIINRISPSSTFLVSAMKSFLTFLLLSATLSAAENDASSPNEASPSPRRSSSPDWVVPDWVVGTLSFDRFFTHSLIEFFQTFISQAVIVSSKLNVFQFQIALIPISPMRRLKAMITRCIPR